MSHVLSLVLVLKQKFIKFSFYWTYKWEKSKKLTLKIELIIFYNDMTNLKDFDSNLLKIDKNLYKGIHIYYIGYITIKRN